MNSLSAAYIFVLIVALSSVSAWKHFKNGRVKHGNLGSPPVSDNIKLPPSEWFDQYLDHFDPADTRTWKQRYFTNSTFYKENGPVFLMIGGEGTASPKWMVQGAWIEYAQQFNALCFQLEHRFYGASHPTEDMSVKNLVYLSSEQALADLAKFIVSMNHKYKLPKETKWIAFGGSYPGSLAAWLRLKYPHLIHAAVSSSGPLLAKANFKEYLGVVDASLATSGQDCVKAVGEAFREIGILLRHRIGEQSLKQKFRLCDDVSNSTSNDISNLFEVFSDNVAEIVQYNKDNRESHGSKTGNITIDVICDIMKNETIGSPVDRYAAVSTLIQDAQGEKCLDFKYDKMLTDMRDTNWGSEAGEGGRQWMYQTCTEFGFYQTSDLIPHIFGDQFPLNFFIQQCSDIYGPKFNITLLNKSVDRTNTIYGGLNIKSSRIIFVHGTIDPWHALGVIETLSEDMPAILINGTAHCANMYPSRTSDLPQLKKARKNIIKLLHKWLKEE